MSRRERGSGFLCLPALSDPSVKGLDRFADALGDGFGVDVGSGIHACMPHLGLDVLKVAARIVSQRSERAAEDLVVDPDPKPVSKRFQDSIEKGLGSGST